MKKDFKKSNPALDLLQDHSGDNTKTENKQKAPDTPPEGYKINPDLYVEKKTKRVNLLMQPSLVERSKRAAEVEGVSMNEITARALKAYLEERGL